MTQVASRGAARRKRHERIRLRMEGTESRPRLAVFRSLNHIYAQVIDDSSGRTLDVPVDGGPRAPQEVLAELGTAGVGLHDAGMRRPTLDEVFLSLTGDAPAGQEDPR